MTPEVFRNLLKNARGRSEWVVVVVCDVRGFSKFSRLNEAPDAAMFIKRLYVQLIDKYFPTAAFAKPTGDGLLLIFPFSEESLREVAGSVLTGCFSCVDDFGSICANDLMINFDVPNRIGFGITRGPACCLYSGDEILDYSGHLLNLAARLTDLARPQGILIDGKFGVIPTEVTTRFKEKRIFVKSLAETEPIKVFCSDHIELPDSALSPIIELDWQTYKEAVNLTTIETGGDWVAIALPSPAVSAEKIRAAMEYPHPDGGGNMREKLLSEFSYMPHESPPRVRIMLDPVREVLKKWKSSNNAPVRFRLEFVPKAPQVIKTARIRRKATLSQPGNKCTTRTKR